MKPIQVQHLGFIVDGNRRWAREHSKATVLGHRKGAEVARDVSLHAFRTGIKYVTLYIFSSENWNRDQNEVKGIMSLVLEASIKEVDKYSDEGIKVLFIGDQNDGRISDVIKKKLKIVEDKTANNTNGVLLICFNYSGQKEIASAVRQLIKESVPEDEVDEKAISDRLYSPEVPPVDLIIRTSGEKRISGFMLWRAAYSELYFTDKYWPEFGVDDLDEALEDYASRQRRFGK